MVFLGFSYGFPVVFLWFTYSFPMVLLWFSYGFPMGFLPQLLGFSHRCLGAGSLEPRRGDASHRGARGRDALERP